MRSIPSAVRLSSKDRRAWEASNRFVSGSRSTLCRHIKTLGRSPALPAHPPSPFLAPPDPINTGTTGPIHLTPKIFLAGSLSRSSWASSP